MDELVPVVLGVVLGALVWVATTGRIRFALSVSAVLVSGISATVLSGEYHESWIYLFLDLGEAALGLAVGILVGQRVLRQRAVVSESVSSVTQERP
jgi:hypothetical protein